ncbi:MAG: NAD(P)/FAD-dependent oxidoreductase [Vicinamibacterales bacterium]
MSDTRYDAIVIGGGINGLTAAALLGQAGQRTLLVEMRDEVGGCAAERVIAPGFRVPALAHRSGPLRADVVERLRLTEHGLSFVAQPYRCTALLDDGRAMALAHAPAAAADAIRRVSTGDAEAWPGFVQSLDRLARVVGTLFARTPPDVDHPGAQDLWTLMRTLGAFRALPTDDAWRLLRWGPMAVADLVSEVFTHEAVRAAVAADGLLGGMFGPWSAGSGLQLLLHEANAAVGVARDTEVAGGPAAAAAALARAARRHGVEVRTGTAVRQIVIRNDRAAGVTLASGDTCLARVVVSALDPRRTCLDLCEPEHVPPEFAWRIRHLRMRGTLAKVHLALSALPAFGDATRAMLAGPVRIAPDLEYLERAFDHAKYGECSAAPWIEFTVPSLADPTRAPAGAHVLSAYVQWVPGEGAAGSRQSPSPTPQAPSPTPHAPSPKSHAPSPDRDAVLRTVLDTLERYAPGLRAIVVQAELITPTDMEAGWGLTGGHIFHGELSLDQAFTMRPLLGWGRYATPISGLYLCGSGTHPGTGLTCGSGANAARVVIDAAT